MISFSTELLQSWISGLLFPLCRVLAVIAAAPILSNRVIPRRVKVGLGVMLTLVIAPTLPTMPQVAVVSAEGILIMLQQFVIGTAIGFSLRIFVAAMELAGQLVSLTMGLGFASFFDPVSGSQSTSLSQFFSLLAMLVFLSMNGHLQLLGALVQSFNTLPVTAAMGQVDPMAIALWGGKIFSAGCMIALPVMSALLITNMALGILTRTAPQLNLFGIGFPITIGLGFLVLVLSMPNMMKPTQQVIHESFRFVDTAVVTPNGKQNSLNQSASELNPAGSKLAE